MRRVLSAIAIAALSLCLATAVFAAEGAKLGAFKLKSGDGADVTNEIIKGKKTMFVIFQTACGQCRGELMDVNKNYEELSKKGNVYAVMVDVAPERGLELYKAAGYKMPILQDPDFVIGNMVDMTSSPATVIVDDEGKVIFAKTGFRPGDLQKLKELF